MKQFYFATVLSLFTLTQLVNSQTLTTRTDATTTPLDERLAAGQNLYVPFGTSPSLNGGLNRQGGLYYNTSNGNLYTYGYSSTWEALLNKRTADGYYALLNGAYSNPSWITSLAWSKLTGTPTTLAGYGITNALAATGGSGYIQNTTSNTAQNAAFNVSGESKIAGITIGRGKGATNNTYNVAIGDGTLSNVNVANSNYNTGIGYHSLLNAYNSTYNTAIGYNSMANVTNVSNNTAIGSNTLMQTLGDYNTAVGYSSMSNATGGYNTAVGAYSLANSTGNYNSAFGYYSLYSNSNGANNSAFGHESLKQNTSGASNSAFGYQSLSNNSIASNNTAFGYQSLQNVSTGNNNTAFGYQSLVNNTASNNTAFGYLALAANTSGTQNVAFGAETGKLITSGSKNTLIGYKAGTGLPGTAEGNVMIGNEAGSTSTGSNKLYIANSPTNNLIYGDFSTGQVIINAGANPALSDFTLDVRGTGRYTNNLRTEGNLELGATGTLKTITGTITADRTYTLPDKSGKILLDTDLDDLENVVHRTGNETITGIKTFNGNVGINMGDSLAKERLEVNGKIRAKAIKVESQAEKWPDFVFEKSYKLPSLYEVERYIQAEKHLPDVKPASTIAKEGVQLGELNTVLLKKIEELTLYVIQLKKELDEAKNTPKSTSQATPQN